MNITEVIKEIGLAVEGKSKLGPLALMSAIKRTDGALKFLKTENQFEANEEYCYESEQADGKLFQVEGSTFKKYTPPVKYKFSPNVAAIDKRMKELKKTEIEEGVATVVPPDTSKVTPNFATSALAERYPVQDLEQVAEPVS